MLIGYPWPPVAPAVDLGIATNLARDSLSSVARVITTYRELAPDRSPTTRDAATAGRAAQPGCVDEQGREPLHPAVDHDISQDSFMRHDVTW